MSSLHNFIFAAFGLTFCFISGSSAGQILVPRPNCDIKTCPGPLYYYEEIGCTPIYENETSCCPIRFNCDRWKNYSYRDDCLINGRVYKWGEFLDDGDVDNVCYTCSCGGYKHCLIPQCEGKPYFEKPGCTYIELPLQCCGWLEVCDDNPFKCIVDGKAYTHGQKFTPQAEPEKTCYCLEGYNGVNDKNYCRWRKPSWCNNIVHRGVDRIIDKCAPVYGKNSALQTDCNVSTRCHEVERDRVITQTSSSVKVNDPNMQCEFGNLTMSIGDRLNVLTEKDNNTSDCICEVPPVPTCRFHR